MRPFYFILIGTVLLLGVAQAEPNPHVVLFGKEMRVKLFLGPREDKSADMNIRALSVDGRIREFTTGEPHQISGTQFVVRKAFRLNDWLPEDQEKAALAPPGSRTAHNWKWQRGGWLLVDIASGRISELKLPDFDPFYSLAGWYRDYVAYCGLSGDGETLYAVVAQLGQKRPVLHQELGPAQSGDLPDSECAQPDWQSGPTRVVFNPVNRRKLTFKLAEEAANPASAPQPPPPQPGKQ